MKPMDEVSNLDPAGFDLGRLRLSQSFDEEIGVQKMIVSVPVRRPDRQWWVRVHPSADWRLETVVLEVKEESRTYLLDKVLWPQLTGELTRKILLTAINRQGAVFIWPIRLPGPDGSLDEWSRSQLEAADMATRSWTRVAANMAIRAYDVFTAAADLPEPAWPEQTFDELMHIGFRDRFIETLEHPVLRKLRGEI